MITAKTTLGELEAFLTERRASVRFYRFHDRWFAEFRVRGKYDVWKGEGDSMVAAFQKALELEAELTALREKQGDL